MKERPILMHARSIQGIQAGRKTQTRRIIRIDNTPITMNQTAQCQRQCGIPTNAQNVRFLHCYLKCDAPPGSETVSARVECPYGYRGDRLWVRETWADLPDGTILYRADVSDEHLREEREARCLAPELAKAYNERRWCSPIHMPRKHARLFLEIEAIRVERVQEISEQDALAEGVEPFEGQDGCPPRTWVRNSPVIDRFARLWDDTNGKGAWDRNDWVWVIQFKQVE